MHSTSQGPTPEDARKDGHIRGRSRQLVKYPGYNAVEKLNVLRVSTKSVIPEVAKSACGGESRENNSLLDTGYRLRLARYDV